MLPVTQAIPPGQRDIDFDEVNTTSPTFVPVPNSIVTVNNGSTPANCILHFSANTTVTPNDQVIFGYAVDLGVCSATGGPDFFHYSEGQELYETRTAVHVRAIPAGIHTITPCFAVADRDLDGIAQVFFEFRALTVECRTR
jgi:hypothetical protein